MRPMSEWLLSVNMRHPYLSKHCKEPFAHLACWFLYAETLVGSSPGVTTSGRNVKSHPFKMARVLRHRSSHTVASCHPPESMTQDLRHIPAVPLNFGKKSARWRTVCSITKCLSIAIAWAAVRNEFWSLRCPQRV